jgi:hypothetical protein
MALIHHNETTDGSSSRRRDSLVRRLAHYRLALSLVVGIGVPCNSDMELAGDLGLACPGLPAVHGRMHETWKSL